MAEISEFDIVPLDELKTKLELYKYNPSLMSRVILDTLKQVTDGKINIVDPTNPFIFLLEASTVNASLFMQENYLNLRRQYPSLAQTQEEIYLHMVDKDYIGRFAIPGRCVFTAAIRHKDIEAAPVDAGLDGRRLTIPKDTEVSVDNIKYTFSYAVDIVLYSNGMVRVQYDAPTQNPLQSLNKSIINYSARKNTDGTLWIFFDIELLQVEIKSTQFPIEFGNIFTQTIPYSNLYTYTRAYYRNQNSGNKWIEMKTTHNELVYDIAEPTLQLQVFNEELSVTLPAVYTNQNIISGELRIDIYTTRGDTTVDLSTYKISTFANVLRSFTDEDIDQHVSVLSDSAYTIYSDKVSTGGSNGISVSELRKRVINNAAGDRQLPISNVQLESFVNNQGFTLVKNIDLITNRVFLATRKLPNPNTNKIISSAAMGLASIIADPVSLSNNTSVLVNPDTYTISSDTLFKLDNGILRFVSEAERVALFSLPMNDFLADVNSTAYYYTPFYYVQNTFTTDEYTLRAYHLDQPKVNYVNFVDQNNTLQLAVNTGSISVAKSGNDYKITVVTQSGGFYKQLGDSSVALQLAYYPPGETKLAYITATQVDKTDTDERIYEILLETNLRIKRTAEGDRLEVENASMFSASVLDTDVFLEQDYFLIYSTNSISALYVPSAIDDKVPSFILGASFRGITEERVSISLGYGLDNLWSKIRPVLSDVVYKRHTEDIPLLYEKTIYDKDPSTGSIFTVTAGTLNYNILHNIGDPVLDIAGDPIYKHRTGDVVLDAQGEPIPEHTVVVNSEMDILLIDAKYLLANDSVYTDYRNSVASLIHTWCSVNLESIQNLLLEQTRIFFSPNTSLSDTQVRLNRERIVNIPSVLSVAIQLYVRNSVEITQELRESVSGDIITYLDNYLGLNKNISVDDIVSEIRTTYSTITESVRVKLHAGTTELYFVEILEEHKRFSLGKKLIQESTGTTQVAENIIVEFLTVN